MIERLAGRRMSESTPPGTESFTDTSFEDEGSVDGRFNGITVMVVDDSMTIRRTAEALLRRAGCEVVTAGDGFESLTRIVDYAPDIVFVDIMMPRLDGYQTCALIKRNETFRDTPVIMLSSKEGVLDRARGRHAGADQYLTKPFTRGELLTAIERHVIVAK